MILTEHDFQVVCHQLVHGNRQIKHEAEQTLINLRDKRESMTLAVNVLSNFDGVPYIVLFQAAQLLKHSTICRWDELSRNDRALVRSKVCICFCILYQT